MRSKRKHAQARIVTGLHRLHGRMSGCDEATLLLPALHAVLQSVTWLTTSRLAPMTLHLSEDRKQPGRSSMLPSRPRRISNPHSSYSILAGRLQQDSCPHVRAAAANAPLGSVWLRASCPVCCSVVWAPACTHTMQRRDGC